MTDQHHPSLERLGVDPAKARAEAALLPGLREALLWKPNTPQLENAMTYAWESALKSFIRAIEQNAPSLASETKAADRDAIIEECARAVIGSRVLWDDELPTVGDRVHDALEQVAEQVRRLKSLTTARPDAVTKSSLAAAEARPKHGAMPRGNYERTKPHCHTKGGI